MHFSKKSQYGLRAAIALAQRASNDYVSIKALSERLDIPGQYLGKILQTLTEQGITESCRGPNGGVRLRLSADEVTVRRLIELFEGEEVFELCPMGFSGCSGHQGCLLGENCPGPPPATIRDRIDVPLRFWAEKIPADAL